MIQETSSSPFVLMLLSIFSTLMLFSGRRTAKVFSWPPVSQQHPQRVCGTLIISWFLGCRSSSAAADLASPSTVARPHHQRAAQSGEQLPPAPPAAAGRRCYRRFKHHRRQSQTWRDFPDSRHMTGCCSPPFHPPGGWGGFLTTPVIDRECSRWRRTESPLQKVLGLTFAFSPDWGL